MIGKLFFVTVLLFCQMRGCSQGDFTDLVYFPPYSFSSVEEHMAAINQGAGYLILTKASFKNEKAYNLACTSWYELPGGQSRNHKNVDSLLNNSNVEISENSIPILDAFIEKYANKSKCELLEMIFNDDGYYEGGQYYISDNIILAALLKRGLRIEVSDYDGNLYFNLESLNCIE